MLRIVSSICKVTYQILQHKNCISGRKIDKTQLHLVNIAKLTTNEELLTLESLTGMFVVGIKQFSRWSAPLMVTFSEVLTGGRSLTIATIAIFMSDLIIKLTKNPVNDNMYKTSLAGTISATKIQIKNFDHPT